ncbi:MAG TPA: nuclear transport factor 2 family protein [Candidatus Desulfovibrio intestinavium]|uniref:Nuclear transport factor 2 family protein n=1 Tax=Candidatus Desulfovibrio intestinavium TaxID=2838534 RepID=A0A9D2HM29_9BACT|nr:nuclear transport factor 2 family protein [Candidatus Desulfovibrio intestinavium]
MKFLRTSLLALAVLALALTLGSRSASAKADVVELYANAVISADADMLEKILAPNYWHVAANGHIQDKEHFIQSIRNKQLVINHLTLTNLRRSMVGDCTLMTGNGILRGKATPTLPEGLMRYSIVIAKNGNQEQVVLFQATPVVPSADCKDGNCALR